MLARGYLCLAEGDAAAAKVEFSEVRKIAQESLYLNPSALAWRSGFALALSEMGLPEDGLQHATNDVELAREFGAGRALAIACTARPLYRRHHGTHGVAPGVGRRGATGGRQAGRSPRAGRSSDDCRWPCAMLRRDPRWRRRWMPPTNAERPECETARRRVQPLGGRPHRRRIHGVKSLTRQERRVSGLAARGMLNREIADELFISIGTVETHLTNTTASLEWHRASNSAMSWTTTPGGSDHGSGFLPPTGSSGAYPSDAPTSGSARGLPPPERRLRELGCSGMLSAGALSDNGMTPST